jgi:hypothetical protein
VSAIDEAGFELPRNPTLLQILTWRILHGTMDVQEARNVILKKPAAKRLLKPISRVPKVLRARVGGAGGGK